MSTLEIRDLHVSVDTDTGAKEILNGVDLTIRSGETHAIMGPNGSGKSTLAYSIAGHPKYKITQGSVTLDGEDLLTLTVDARARAGADRREPAHHRHQVADPPHLREAPREVVGAAPVGGGATAVQQPRLGEEVGAGADAGHPPRGLRDAG